MKILLIGLLLIAQTAWADSLKPTAPSKDNARKACPIHRGEVVDLIPVTIEGNDDTVKTATAAIGGYIGHDMAKDKNNHHRDKTVGALLGAGLGYAVGKLVAPKLVNKKGTEVIVAVKDKAYSVIQETDSAAKFSAGDSVWVIGDLTNTGYWYRSNNRCTLEVRVLPRKEN